jgi:hypothetical protein
MGQLSLAVILLTADHLYEEIPARSRGPISFRAEYIAQTKTCVMGQIVALQFELKASCLPGERNFHYNSGATMREGRIVLPITTATNIAYHDAKQRLVDAFGGITVTFGNGTYKGEHWTTTEPVEIIDVAYVPEWDNDAKLYDIASRFQQEAKQESVYVRYANGVVQLVTAQSCMQSNAVFVEAGQLKDEFTWEKLRADLNEPADDPGDVVMTEAQAAGEDVGCQTDEDRLATTLAP